ncbi:MAG: YeeE/YedE thiosulfate transporter family protein [Armatimonadota bacterium]
MFKKLHENQPSQRILGFVMGIVFGFLLQKGGVADYNVILDQLLLKDFTVVKIMLTAIVVGMLGVNAMKAAGWVKLHPKAGSVGGTVLGGLIFGVAFGILGYCPGTLAAAAGQGAWDALVAGLSGIILGAGLFAAAYPRLAKTVLNRGEFGDVTLPELVKLNPWIVIGAMTVVIVGVLWLLETSGL